MNIEPENDGLEDVFPFPGVFPQVGYVSSLDCYPKVISFQVLEL